MKSNEHVDLLYSKFNNGLIEAEKIDDDEYFEILKDVKDCIVNHCDDSLLRDFNKCVMTALANGEEQTVFNSIVISEQKRRDGIKDKTSLDMAALEDNNKRLRITK